MLLGLWRPLKSNSTENGKLMDFFFSPLPQPPPPPTSPPPPSHSVPITPLFFLTLKLFLHVWKWKWWCFWNMIWGWRLCSREAGGWVVMGEGLCEYVKGRNNRNAFVQGERAARCYPVNTHTRTHKHKANSQANITDQIWTPPLPRHTHTHPKLCANLLRLISAITAPLLDHRTRSGVYPDLFQLGLLPHESFSSTNLMCNV